MKVAKHILIRDYRISEPSLTQSNPFDFNDTVSEVKRMAKKKISAKKKTCSKKTCSKKCVAPPEPEVISLPEKPKAKCSYLFGLIKKAFGYE